VTDLKFFVDTSVLDDDSVHESVKQCVLDVAARLDAAGAKVRKGECPAFREAVKGIEKWGWLGGVEASLEYADWFNGPRRDEMDPLVSQRLESCAAIGRDAVIRLYQLRERLRIQIAEDLRDAVLLTPTTPHTAPLLSDAMRSSEEYFRLNTLALRYTAPGNLMDMPGISLPAGTDANGLPFGIQLSVPFGEDGRLLAAAQAAESFIAGK
jgi:aspartyl-tRNA(Asn)/glutamyl-tRNA(Gln) amidotransferase subunit A